MRKSKKLFFVLTVLLITAISATVYAASAYSSPAEATADLTGMTLDEVKALRLETGDSYCEIAEEAGKLDEFKAAVLEIKKDSIEDRVANGTLTQERATEMILKIEQDQINCDGTGQQNHVGAGQAGMGQNNGTGQQNRDGTCSGSCAGTMARSGKGGSN
jgi:hypothetical protein